MPFFPVLKKNPPDRRLRKEFQLELTAEQWSIKAAIVLMYR